MAVARRLPQTVEGLVLTTSQAVWAVRQEGLPVEHFPPLDPGADRGERARWNTRLAGRVSEVLEEYDPGVVVFDGTYPYQGVIQPVWQAANRSFVWCRRGMWRPGEGTASLALSWAFDTIIEPGELAADGASTVNGDAGPEPVGVGPIVLLEERELLERSAAESALGLAPEGTNVLIQLGAGKINDKGSPTAICLARLEGERDIQVVVAESPIAQQALELPADASSLQIYPIAKFYRAFDFVVSEAGYNSFHELISYGVPALYVPNLSKPVENQLARSEYAESVGVGRQWDGVDLDGLDDSLRELLDVKARDRMRRRARELRFDNGAGEAARLVAEQSETRTRLTRAAGRRAYSAAMRGTRSAYGWLLGWLPSGAAARVRRALGGAGGAKRYAVGGPSQAPRDGTGEQVELLCLALGASQEVLGELIEETDQLVPGQPSRLLFVTDCDRFHPFARLGYRFEYVPPRVDWEGRVFSSDYDSFLERRLAAISDAYGPNRTLELTRRSGGV
jgi:hypothetical protein